MSGPSTLPIAWSHVRQRGIAVIAAAVIYDGLATLISALKYQLASVVVRIINAVVATGFRDLMLLRDTFIPWRYQAVPLAAGCMEIAVGILFGLWAFSRSKRQVSTSK